MVLNRSENLLEHRERMTDYQQNVTTEGAQSTDLSTELGNEELAGSEEDPEDKDIAEEK